MAEGAEPEPLGLVGEPDRSSTATDWSSRVRVGWNAWMGAVGSRLSNAHVTFFSKHMGRSQSWRRRRSRRGRRSGGGATVGRGRSCARTRRLGGGRGFGRLGGRRGCLAGRHAASLYSRLRCAVGTELRIFGSYRALLRVFKKYN